MEGEVYLRFRPSRILVSHRFSRPSRKHSRLPTLL